MTIGYAITKASMDNQMGALVVNLRNALNAVVSFDVLLDDTAVLPDSVLSGSLSYTTPEIATIRAAFNDLRKLSDISRALATQSATNDFWFNAKMLSGVQLL